MKRYCCLRDVQDLLIDGKYQNERIFGESFKNMLCSRREFWEEHILIAEIEELEKLDASETYPRRVKDRILYFASGDSIPKLCKVPCSHYAHKSKSVVKCFQCSFAVDLSRKPFDPKETRVCHELSSASCYIITFLRTNSFRG